MNIRSAICGFVKLSAIRSTGRWQPSDRAASVFPILIFEETLVELACGMAGKFGAKVNGAWALHIGQL